MIHLLKQSRGRWPAVIPSKERSPAWSEKFWPLSETINTLGWALSSGPQPGLAERASLLTEYKFPAVVFVKQVIHKAP